MTRLPLLVLGRRPADGIYCCLDCADGGDVVVAGDDAGEHARCARCGGWLRHARAFGQVHQDNIDAPERR